MKRLLFALLLFPLTLSLTSCGLSREERAQRLSECLRLNPYWPSTYAWASYNSQCERTWGCDK